MHALTGIDTITANYDVGYKMALKALQTIYPGSVSIIGDFQANLTGVGRVAPAYLLWQDIYADSKSLTKCHLKM